MCFMCIVCQRWNGEPIQSHEQATKGNIYKVEGFLNVSSNVNEFDWKEFVHI
jgi:hypothetical protein